MNIGTNHDKSLKVKYLTLAAASVLVLMLTFVISNIDLAFEIKLTIFAAATLVYLLFIFVSYRQQYTENLSTEDDSKIFNAETEEKLLILEEAGEFFGASLKSGDMFRLISGRIGELIPFANCSLFLIDETKTSLKIAYSTGENAKLLRNSQIKISDGLAEKLMLAGNRKLMKNFYATAPLFRRKHSKI